MLTLIITLVAMDHVFGKNFTIVYVLHQSMRDSNLFIMHNLSASLARTKGTIRDGTIKYDTNWYLKFFWYSMILVRFLFKNTS